MKKLQRKTKNVPMDRKKMNTKIVTPFQMEDWDKAQISVGLLRGRLRKCTPSKVWFTSTKMTIIWFSSKICLPNQLIGSNNITHLFISEWLKVIINMGQDIRPRWDLVNNLEIDWAQEGLASEIGPLRAEMLFPRKDTRSHLILTNMINIVTGWVNQDHRAIKDRLLIEWEIGALAARDLILRLGNHQKLHGVLWRVRTKTHTKPIKHKVPYQTMTYTKNRRRNNNWITHKWATKEDNRILIGAKARSPTLKLLVFWQVLSGMLKTQ